MVIQDERDHLPVLILLYFAGNLMTPHLFVQRIQKLLSGRGAGERRAMVLGAAKTAKVEQPFRSAREGNSHAIEKINDRRRHLAHRFGGWLIRKKVAAINRVIEMFPGGIAFAFGVNGAIDAALRTNRMRALDGYDREEVDGVARLG